MTLTDEYKIKLKKNGQIKTISINTDPQAGKVAENDKNKNSAAEREAQNRAFNEGFYGTDSHGYEVLKPVSINQGSGRMRKQNNISQGDPFLEGLWGEDAPTQQDTYYSSTRNAEKQYREPDPDFEKAFLEGFMGEDYTKEMQAGIKNIALPKQENYSNTANNKHNSAAGDIGKKTVRSEGLHYLPNGGTDSYGRQLPAGSYIRVQNGTEYVVLPNDPRIKERIAAEYAAQEAAKQDKPPISPEQKEIPEILQIGAEKPAAEPNPEADENWENAFSGSDSEEKIELPNNIFGEDEIDTSDYDSFIDYVEENRLYYDFYIGYNEQGEKVRFAELYDSETGERLATLQEGRDFFYAEDGVFFTKDFTYNSRGRKILEMRAGIYVGDDAKELFESLGYEISISGNTIYITDETGKTLTFARGEEFSATKNGIFIAPGALNSKTIQDLIKNSPKSRGIVSSNSNSSLEIMRSYAGDAANDENTVTHAVVSAMEALDSDKALRQEVETNKQQGLGAQIWDALNNAWDSLVKSVSGVDEAFKNAGESFIKGVSGIDEAVAAGGQALTKSTRDLKKVLSSEDTRNALWFALYSILAAHTGGLTTMISSGDKNLDEAWEKINNVRMISPSSWTKTISYITLPETRVLLNSISNQDHAKLLFEVVNNADTIASMSAEELEPILEDMVKCLTGELIKPFISEW